MVTNASLYEVSFLDGGLDPQSDEKDFETSDAQDVVEDFYFAKRWLTGDPQVLVDVDSIGSLYKAHLGADTPTGAGPYTHAITKSTPLWTTFMEMKPGVAGGTDYWIEADDVWIRAIEVEAMAGEPLNARLDLLGKKDKFNMATPPVPGRDMRLATTPSAGSIATMIGSTLKLDLATTPATTAIHNIERATIRSEYSGDLIQTDEINPSYRFLGRFALGVTAEMIMTAVEFQLLASTFYNTTTITTDMLIGANPANPITGAGLLTFNTIGATASRSVAFTMPAMRWTATFPKVQPSGDAVRVTMTGKTKYNANPLTVTAINNRPTY